MAKLPKIKRTTKGDPLSQLESKMVADFLRSKGWQVHWSTLWRMSPAEVSEKYGVAPKEVISACRRKVLA